MKKILVDGVFFQLNNTGIARVWRTILGLWAKSKQFEIFLLDRGNAPVIENINYIPFPKDLICYCPAGSSLIQKVCDYYEIDVFTSTYYTTPLTTPMLLMVYDMIPEMFEFDLTQRAWMEKETAISYAQRYLCISHNTRDDLLSCYSEIPVSKVSVAHCGVDRAVFYPRSSTEIKVFCEKYDCKRPFFLFVGSRVQHNGYKNSALFFKALSNWQGANFDILCVGGEKEIEPKILDMIPRGVHCHRIELTDDELATAYSVALALVYPSLYEGFGMPVIEAMASGCPVITTRHGSLAEAAGEAACFIGGMSVDEMRAALGKMLNSDYRQVLREKGIEHAKNFKWEDMAQRLTDDIDLLISETLSGQYDTFFSQWKLLRSIQANVDFMNLGQ